MAKISLLLLALHALLAASLPQASPQASPKALPQAKDKKAMSFDEMATSVKPAVVVDAQPLIRKTATRKLFRFGPYDLPGAKV
jgi:hypothetical protein